MEPNGPPLTAFPGPRDRGDAHAGAEPERLRALLVAMNAFLICDDIDEVGRAIEVAIGTMFAPDKGAVTIQEPDGTVRLVSASGYDAAELERIRAALGQGRGMVRQVLAGTEMWSDDSGRRALRARIREYGAESGFSLPIASPSGVVGTISCTYREPRAFDSAFRGAARNLATQAGLAISLIASRLDARRSAAESARRHRTASALLHVAGQLAAITDPVAIHEAIAIAVRDAARAAAATVARTAPDETGFTMIATAGLTPEQAAYFHGRLLPAEPGTGSAETMAGRTTIQTAATSPILRRAGLSVAVSAPIVIEGRIWGFVAVADADIQFSHDELVELVTGFGAIAATAIARAEAVGELDRQRRRSNTLLELSSILAGTQDRISVEQRVCAMVRQASGAPFAMVGRRDDATDRFVVAATDGLDTDQIGRISAALRTIDRPSLRALLGGFVTSRTGEAAVGAGMGIGHAMGAPIVIAGRTEGFIAIGAPGTEVVHAAEWQELLTALAAVTATALARAVAAGALARQRDTLASEVEERTRSLQAAVDELRLASDAKTDFLANVSHELRTPLTSILGFAEILATGMDGPLNEDQARDLDTVRVSSHHLLELIDDLIDIASIESGRIQLQIGRVDVDEVVRDAAETIRPLAEAKDTTLVVALSARRPDVPPTLVAADRGRLREIVLNLLSNAVKFTPAGGRVAVSVATEDSRVAISVHDSGPGIAPGDQERIFEKFVRIATAATPGTGLGLAISRELARLHDGELTVESDPGVGSTFTVRIPRAPR